MKLLYIIPLILLTSCASKKPKLFKDQYGILHRTEVNNPNEINAIVLTTSYDDIPYGCTRLRNVYLDGWSNKAWELKTEAAKQFGTHIVKEYINNMQDTMGIPFDCKDAHNVRAAWQLQKRVIRNKALGELERRTYHKGHANYNKPDEIPVIHIGD